MDNLYFSRAAMWMRHGDGVVVKDSFGSRAPRMITMDPWPLVVFMAATGTVTIGAFIEQLASEYAADPPPGLRAQVHDLIEQLVAEEILRTHPSPARLPRYFEYDLLTIPPEVRAELLRADGLIP